MARGRCAWEVVAGIVPTQVQAEHTKTWALTSEEWNSPEGLRLYVERGQAARAYAQYLELQCSQGRMVNWVRLDFIWF